MSDPLEDLKTRIGKCRICRDDPQGTALPHEPRPVLQATRNARILIAGQAPGTRVHQSGKPFTDPSGDRLRDWMGVNEDVFYDHSRIAIVPMGFCFPGLDAKGGDLPPRKECALAWRQVVLGHLPNLELILVIGQYAQRWHLKNETEKTLTATVANWRFYLNRKPEVIPLPHPSWRNSGWIKKNPWFETDLLPYLKDRIQRTGISS